jgi:hypothetical protein
MRMDLGKVGCGGLDWFCSGRGKVESSCEFGNEPLGSIKCLETIEWPLEWCSAPELVKDKFACLPLDFFV